MPQSVHDMLNAGLKLCGWSSICQAPPHPQHHICLAYIRHMAKAFDSNLWWGLFGPVNITWYLYRAPLIVMSVFGHLVGIMAKCADEFVLIARWVRRLLDDATVTRMVNDDTSPFYRKRSNNYFYITVYYIFKWVWLKHIPIHEQWIMKDDHTETPSLYSS